MSCKVTFQIFKLLIFSTHLECDRIFNNYSALASLLAIWPVKMLKIGHCLTDLWLYMKAGRLVL